MAELLPMMCAAISILGLKHYNRNSWKWHSKVKLTYKVWYIVLGRRHQSVAGFWNGGGRDIDIFGQRKTRQGFLHIFTDSLRTCYLHPQKFLIRFAQVLQLVQARIGGPSPHCTSPATKNLVTGDLINKLTKYLC